MAPTGPTSGCRLAVEPSLVNRSVGDLVGRLLTQIRLCPDLVKDPKTLTQGVFKDLRVAPTRTSGANADLTNETLVEG